MSSGRLIAVAAEREPGAAEVLSILASLRATRHFTTQPVADKTLTDLVDVARWTGSARNRQPWRFLAVRDPQTKTALSQLGGYAQHLAAAPVVLVALSEERGWSDTEFDLGRITQTIALAAHALGLGTCVATIYPEENVMRAAAILELASPWRAHHAIALGHPAPILDRIDWAIPQGRLSVGELLSHQPLA